MAGVSSASTLDKCGDRPRSDNANNIRSYAPWAVSHLVIASLAYPMHSVMNSCLSMKLDMLARGPTCHSMV